MARDMLLTLRCNVQTLHVAIEVRNPCRPISESGGFGTTLPTFNLAVMLLQDVEPSVTSASGSEAQNPRVSIPPGLPELLQVSSIC
jgi:hypothetical protein